MRLKELRNKMNLTQAEVAKYLNVHTMTYSGYENGKREPNIEMLIKLARFYHVTIDDIVGEDTNILNLNALESDKVNMIKQILNMNNSQTEQAKMYLNALMKQ